MHPWHCVTFCILSIWTGNNNAINPTVTSDFGTLIGSTTKSSWTHKTIYQFRGIRYAESPSGVNRFKVCQLEST